MGILLKMQMKWKVFYFSLFFGVPPPSIKVDENFMQIAKKKTYVCNKSNTAIVFLVVMEKNEGVFLSSPLHILLEGFQFLRPFLCKTYIFSQGFGLAHVARFVNCLGLCSVPFQMIIIMLRGNGNYFEWRCEDDNHTRRRPHKDTTHLLEFSPRRGGMKWCESYKQNKKDIQKNSGTSVAQQLGTRIS